MKNIEYEDIKAGMSVSYSQTITDADFKFFSELSGDHYPVYVMKICSRILI